MATLRPSICIITSFILLIQITAQGQQCDEGRNTPKFARTYIVAYDGPFDSFGVVRSNETVSMTLGGCRTFDDHVDKIIEHFQTRYNIDINHIRSDPLARYEDDEFIIAQNSATSENRDVVIAGTVNRDGRYLNIPLFWNFWSLIAKKDMSTRQGIVKAGNWLEYGMFRFTDEGREVCLEVMSRSSTGTVIPTAGAAPLDLIVKSTDWGEGVIRGMGGVMEKLYSVRYSIAFPLQS